MRRRHPEEGHTLESVVRNQLEQDGDAREILRQLNDDPTGGASALIRRFAAPDTPAPIVTAVRGGEIGRIVNIASLEALKISRSTQAAVSPAIARRRLVLGWDLLVDVTVMLDPSRVAPSEADRDAVFWRTIGEINDLWSIDIQPPRRSMASAELLHFITERIAARDPGGAAIVRAGGMLRLWWQCKDGVLEEEMLWAVLIEGLADLDSTYPGAGHRVRSELESMRGTEGDPERDVLIVTFAALSIAGVQPSDGLVASTMRPVENDPADVSTEDPSVAQVAAIHEWLDTDDDGREILRELANDPPSGALALLDRLRRPNAPLSIRTLVAGGDVGTVLNIGSVAALTVADGPAPAVSQAWVRTRLQFGWRLAIDGTTRFVTSTDAGRHLREVLPDLSQATIDDLNAIFGTTIRAPEGELSARDYLEHIALRVARVDHHGASVIEFGGLLALLWTVQGQPEALKLLWSGVDDSFRQLEAGFPAALADLRATLEPLRSTAAGVDAAPILDRVAGIIAGVGNRGMTASTDAISRSHAAAHGDTIVNIASGPQAGSVDMAAITPAYAFARLRLGWQLCMSSIWLQADEGAAGLPPNHVENALADARQMFKVAVSPPADGLRPRDYLDHFLHRLAPADATGAAVVNLGGMLCLWWSTKGLHGGILDDELWSTLDEAITHLGFSVPGAPALVHTMLIPCKPGTGDPGKAVSFLRRLGEVIANSAREG